MERKDPRDLGRRMTRRKDRHGKYADQAAQNTSFLFDVDCLVYSL